MWRYLIPVVIFGVLAVVLAGGLHLQPNCVPSPLVGKAAPVFILTKVEDPSQQISNHELAGKKYLVNVWATWCSACRAEQDALMRIAKQNVIPIVGIDWKDELPMAQRWLSQLGNPYVGNGFDGDGRTAIDYGVYGAPETFLVNEHGVIIYKYVGEITDEVWQNSFLPRINGTGKISDKDKGGTTCS